jgi:hypothetical protein
MKRDKNWETFLVFLFKLFGSNRYRDNPDSKNRKPELNDMLKTSESTLLRNGIFNTQPIITIRPTDIVKAIEILGTNERILFKLTLSL